MKINIQSPSFQASDKLTDFTLDKVNKLAQFTDRIIEVQVILRINKSETRDNKFCEILLAIPGNDLFASKQAATFEDAVMKTVEALKHQLVSWKQKTQNRSHNQTTNFVETEE
jgi:putative sigma-54 modulation protein